VGGSVSWGVGGVSFLIVAQGSGVGLFCLLEGVDGGL